MIFPFTVVDDVGYVTSAVPEFALRNSHVAHTATPDGRLSASGSCPERTLPRNMTSTVTYIMMADGLMALACNITS